MRTRHVVTAFLLHPDTACPRLLLGKRSRAVRTYPGRWAAISGALPPEVAPEAQARREVREEAGFPTSRLRLLLEGPPFATVDQGLAVRWIVHPFLFRLRGAAEVRPDWEHTRLEWAEPAAIQRRSTVPDLARAWASVAWALEVPAPLLRAALRIRADHEEGSTVLARRGLQALADRRWSLEEVRLGAMAIAAARPAMAAIAVNAALALAARRRSQPLATLLDAAEARRTALAAAVAESVSGVILTHSYSGSVLDGLRDAIAAWFNDTPAPCGRCSLRHDKVQGAAERPASEKLMPHRRLLVLTLPLIAALALAACGGDGDGDGGEQGVAAPEEPLPPLTGEEGPLTVDDLDGLAEEAARESAEQAAADQERPEASEEPADVVEDDTPQRTDATTHAVQAGDSLLAIADRFGITLEALLEVNGILDPNDLDVGQVLIIPAQQEADEESEDAEDIEDCRGAGRAW